MSALTLSRVTVRRGGRPVLDGVDAVLAAGRLTAVIGPNGAGKSTMLEVAAGLLAPDDGEARLGDSNVRGLPRRELALRRAYLPQRAGVEWPISVERVVALGLTPSLPAFGALPAAMDASVARALAECDVTHLATRAATTLSGGELARVMLARAIVGDPELLLVDEPTAGLDPRHALDAMRRLRARADAGRTVALCVHELDLALRFADDIVALKDGRLHWAGGATAIGEEELSALFDVEVRIVRDARGTAVRLLG